MQEISWNILGQTYVPKNCTEHSFSWHATLPPGTFVPPHIHPDQDEYLYMLEGKLGRVLINPERSWTWRCPHYPRKRTSGPAFRTSALCQEQSLCGNVRSAQEAIPAGLVAQQFV